jgi:hypothetical protein
MPMIGVIPNDSEETITGFRQQFRCGFMWNARLVKRHTAKNPANGWTYLLSPKLHKILFAFFWATFGHSSVIFKSKTFIEHSLRYDESKVNCQDWGTNRVRRWVNCGEIYLVFNEVS